MTTTTTPFAYTHAAWPIPDRTTDGHRRSWERLSAPGEWWSGAERISIAAETRRAAALIDGLPDPGPGPTNLPEAAVYTVQTLIGDLPNLTREWYEQTVSAPGMSDAHYIELLGVVVQVWAIDEIHRALSLPLEPLPEPQAGAPTQRRPAGAADHGSWTPVVMPPDLDPEDADIYGGRPRTANVISALSLVPENVRWLNELRAAQYMSWEQTMHFDPASRALSQPQFELLAARTSALNECFY